MTFRIFEESLDFVREELTTALRETRTVPIPDSRFDWLYDGNPDGKTVIWTVRRMPERELAGFTIALPRRVVVDGEVHSCWNCADFSIRSRYRTLGIAAKLRRAATDGVNAGRVDFLYAHPNERMQVVHEHVGHAPVGRMVRYAKVLHSFRHIRERISLPGVSAFVAAAIDRIVRFRGRGHRYTSEITLDPDLRFDDRFDELFWHSASRHRVVGVRDAAYLKWRYRENPVYASCMLTAEREGRLVGYAIYVVESDVVHVKDVFTSGEAGICEDLVAALIVQGTERRLTSISFVTLESSPLVPVLRRFGFVHRPPDTTMFVHVATDSPLRDIVRSCDNWFLTVGDRDV